jgi:hypothetical protein
VYELFYGSCSHHHLQQQTVIPDVATLAVITRFEGLATQETITDSRA